MQDTLRHNKQNTTFGFRFDRFSSGASVFKTPNDPQILGRNLSPSILKRAPVHTFFSPRVNFAYYHNDRWSFGFDFGKYVQQVRLSDVYASRQTRIENLKGRSFLDTRGAAARPVSSSQTAFGVDYQPHPGVQIHSKIFTKSTDGLLQYAQIVNPISSQVPAYLVYESSGESEAKGMELTVNFQKQGWNGFLNYTFSDVSGLSSYTFSNLTDVLFMATGQPLPLQSRTLEYNFKHNGNLLLNYIVEESAPSWLQNSGFNLLFTFHSGHEQGIYDLKPG